MSLELCLVHAAVQVMLRHEKLFKGLDLFPLHTFSTLQLAVTETDPKSKRSANDEVDAISTSGTTDLLSPREKLSIHRASEWKILILCCVAISSLMLQSPSQSSTRSLR